MSTTLTKKQQEVLSFLKHYYEENGFSPSMKEVAEHFDVTISTVQGYFNELIYKGVIKRNPNQPRAVIFKEAVPKNMTVTIPILGKISAGEGILVEEESDPEMVEFPSEWVLKSNMRDYYGLRVMGFSMYEDGILDGDIILVRRQAVARNGDTIVAIRKDKPDERATLKVFYDRGNKIELKPKNEFLNSLLLDRKDVEIRGKFCGLLRQDS